MKKNLFNLKYYLEMHVPDLAFISEPMTFQCDLWHHMKYLKHDYCVSLNSEDLHSPDIPLVSSRAKGGTLILWRKYLDPFINIHITDTSSFLPIILELPNCTVSIHIALYLPTAGKDSEYIAELSKLRTTIDDLSLKFPSSIVFIRGDANASEKNSFRKVLFSNFCKDYNLTRTVIDHRTYHHFLGGGQSDSDLDVLLFSTLPGVHEDLVNIHCKLSEPAVDSCHDILVSRASIPFKAEKILDKSKNIAAPRIKNYRQKVIWSDKGILHYQKVTSQLLPQLRDRWEAESKASLSVLLQATNSILTIAASEINKTISLSTTISSNTSLRVPKEIRKSGNAVSKANSDLKFLIDDGEDNDKILKAKIRLKSLKQIHRRLVRRARMNQCIYRDKRLFDIASKHPSSSYRDIKKIRSLNNSTNASLQKLNVAEKVYENENISDGFYDSISSLLLLKNTRIL